MTSCPTWRNVENKTTNQIDGFMNEILKWSLECTFHEWLFIKYYNKEAESVERSSAAEIGPYFELPPMPRDRLSCQEVSRCCTRGESQGMCNIPSANKADHSGFESITIKYFECWCDEQKIKFYSQRHQISAAILWQENFRCAKSASEEFYNKARTFELYETISAVYLLTFM